MSNQAYLFAEDTPTPYDPASETSDPNANSAFVAGAAYQIPVFWLSCFDKGDLTEVESEAGDIPTFVSEMTRVRSRLAKREPAISELFPSHIEAWREFREAVEVAPGMYLKLDATEIWCLHEDATGFGLLLGKALGWFESRKKAELVALLSLAGIEEYDSKTKRFFVGDNAPERFLYGWLED